MFPDQLATDVFPEQPQRFAASLAVDGSPTVFALATEAQQPVGLYRSHDDGRTWQPVTDGCRVAPRLSPEFATDGTAVCWTDRPLNTAAGLQTQDGGVTWSPATNWMEPATMAAFGPDQGMLWFGFRNGVILEVPVVP